MHIFGENSSYVTIFLYLNWTEATKIEWKLWKWHRYFEIFNLTFIENGGVTHNFENESTKDHFR
jgi:hypothetical protein